MFKSFSLDCSNGVMQVLKTRINALGPDYGLQDMRIGLRKAVESLDTDDVSSIMDVWFRQTSVDVFISHSSKDDELAKMFGGYLKECLGISSFIDSVMWQHIDDLLKHFDRSFAVLSNNDGSITYNYNKRNVTTAHAHVILAQALTRMIDKTPCFIFLKTENSSVNQASWRQEIQTYSPWLYHELCMVDCIEPRFPSDLLIKEGFAFDDACLVRKMQLKYTAPGSKLEELTFRKLIELEKVCRAEAGKSSAIAHLLGVA